MTADKSILDTKTFDKCRTDPELIKDCLVAFLFEEGFDIDSLPPENIRNKLLNTFIATVAIRALVPPVTPMREVISMWDKVMLNYAAARVAHNPACLAESDGVDDSRIILAD